MWILSLLLLGIAALLHPTHARCPPMYDLRTGIRRSGHFECWPHPVGDPEWDGTYGRPERSVQPDGVLDGRIYCGGGRPIVVDAVRVGCESGGDARVHLRR